MVLGEEYKIQIQWQRFFFRCFAASLFIHLLTAWFSVGFQYQDEQSQIMDFAGYKMGMVPLDRLSWEYKEQIRQGIQPLMVVWLYRSLQFFNIANPFLCTFILRIFSTILGWASILFLTKEFCKRIESAYWKRFLVILACFIWPIAFVQSHFSCESLTGSLFFMGVACLLNFDRIEKDDKRRILLLLAAGTLVSLAFIIRIQTVFMVIGLGLWCLFIGRYSLRSILLMIIPGVLVILMGVVIDHWLYGEWVFTMYKYFYVNIVLDKASSFGTSPFYFYFYMYYIGFIAIFSIFIIGCIVFSWFRFPKHILTWICVPFFVGHSLIAHKEVRFLWPMIDAIPMLLVLPFLKIDVSHFKRKSTFMPLKIMWGLNFVLLIFFTIKPGYNAFGLYQHLYNYAKYNSETLVISNVNNPYDMDGATISFQRPPNTFYEKCRNIEDITKLAKASNTKNILVAINNNALADSFEKIYPNMPRLYKSWPAWVNYMKIHSKDAINQVWYLYKWKTKETESPK